MNKRTKNIIAVTAAAVMLAGAVSVYAESGSTAVSLTVANRNTYELVIPAATTVSDFGWTELASSLKVKGKISAHKLIEVTFSSENNFKFMNEGKTKSMAYSLKQTSDGSALTSLNFSAAEVTETGGEGKTLGVFVSQDAWNAVPGGSYTDVVTFTAALTDSPD